MTEPAAKPLKVAIVGTAPTSNLLAPFADPSWDIWACSAGNVNILPRVNMWFEMHAINEMMAVENRAMAEPFYKWLREQSEADKFNVVMLEFNSYVPKAIPYPRDDMIKEFGRNWFTSTVAYMMAIAIARGASEIGLFGVDMAADQEHYQAQRAGCVRFIEIAQERGIKISVPDESCLLASTPMYGYWEGTPFGRRINATIAQVQAGYNAAAQQSQLAKDNANYMAGGLEQLRYFQRTWVDGAELDIDLSKLPAVLKAEEIAAAATMPAAPVPASTDTPGPAPSLPTLDGLAPHVNGAIEPAPAPTGD